MQILRKVKLNYVKERMIISCFMIFPAVQWAENYRMPSTNISFVRSHLFGI